MRTTLLASFAALSVLAAGCRGLGPSPAWLEPGRKAQVVLKASTDVGQIKHEENSNLIDMDSDWEAWMVRPRLVAELRTRAGFEASVEVSGLFAGEDDEKWKVGGANVSSNQLEIGSWEFRTLAGWGLDVERVGHFSLLGGLAARFSEMERKFDNGRRTKFDADMYFLEGELRAVLPLRKDSLDIPANMEMSASYGWLLNPEADVDGAGTIEGDRGWLLRLRAGLDFQFSERASLYLGGYWEVLKIEGGTKGADEWPDSESTAGGAEFGVRVRY